MTLNLTVLWVSFFSSWVLYIKRQSVLFIPYFSNFFSWLSQGLQKHEKSGSAAACSIGWKCVQKKKHLTGGKSEVPSKGREEKMHESRRAL